MPLDIGIGICLAITGARIFNTSSLLPIVLWSIGFALLPDIDVFAELIQRRGALGGKELGLHRQLTHYPIIYILPAVLIIIFAGPLWGYLFVGGVLLHLIHDSVGMGWGIQWLWPFSKNSYKFFSNAHGEASWNFIVHWKPEALKGVVREHGDPDWIKHYYIELKPIVIVEFIVLAISSLILFYVAH